MAKTLEQLLEGHEVKDSRKETLVRAIELGASDDVLETLRDALRIHRNSQTIVLPALRYEHLSRGRGWARKGRGREVTWGERVDGGYQVGPGRWTVGATDGFSRKDSCDWSVKHVQVGSETWTIAN